MIVCASVGFVRHTPGYAHRELGMEPGEGSPPQQRQWAMLALHSGADRSQCLPSTARSLTRLAELPWWICRAHQYGGLPVVWSPVRIAHCPSLRSYGRGAIASSCRNLLLETRCFCLVPYWAQWSSRPSDRDNQSDDTACGRIIALGLWSWGIQGRPPVGRAESQGQSPSGALFCLYQGCCSYNNKNNIFWCWAHAYRHKMALMSPVHSSASQLVSRGQGMAVRSHSQ